MGTETTPSSNMDHPEPARFPVTDPKTMLNLTFFAHLLVPTNLVPHFPYTDLEGFSALGGSLGVASPLSSSYEKMGACSWVTLPH